MNPESLPKGGPAFPCYHQNMMNGQPLEEMSGMSLRDHFAGLALQGLCASDAYAKEKYEVIAREAYQAADAMIKAREAK